MVLVVLQVEALVLEAVEAEAIVLVVEEEQAESLAERLV